jgi:hypothetical protein
MQGIIERLLRKLVLVAAAALPIAACAQAPQQA